MGLQAISFIIVFVIVVLLVIDIVAPRRGKE